MHIAIAGQDTLPGVPSPAPVHGGASFGAMMSFCVLYTCIFACFYLYLGLISMCIYLSTCKYIWWDYPINIYTICKISNLSSFQFWICNITCIGTSNMEILRHLFPFILCHTSSKFLRFQKQRRKRRPIEFLRKCIWYSII